MEAQIASLIETAQTMPLWLGLLALGVSATIEYVFPPFPGDVILLTGALLIALAGWPLWAVFTVALIGSVVGAAIDLEVGRWLGRADRETWLHRWLRKPKVERRVASLRERFQRHGSVYIVLNRFLPAFRSLFFVVAGMAGLKRRSVLLFAAVSAALWTGAILALGAAVSHNIEALVGWFERYTTAVWIGLGVLALAWAARRGWARWREA